MIRSRPVEHPTLGPFNHIGIEVPDKQTVDDIAAKAKDAGCLILGPHADAETNRLHLFCARP